MSRLLTFSIIFNFSFLIFNSQTNSFQQEVNYKMDVRLNDQAHSLSATEEIIYKNNSPSELTFIYFHLWPNAYRNNQTALAEQHLRQGSTNFYYSTEEERGFIDSLDFKVDGKPAKIEYDENNIDICKLILNEPLKSGQSITITTPFYLKIPDAKFSRLGHVGQAYFITQWYPKPAVYDNAGWHPIPYLDQGEFYSEFGSFDVKITLPKNYLLAATGDRVDAAEEEQFIESKVNETLERLKNADYRKKEMDFPPSSAEMKTIRFKQNKVHDFAWFADKRYNVVHDTVVLPKSGKVINTWVYFTNKNFELWKNAITYVNDATYFYSRKVGDYPYDHVTAVDGTIMAGGGMEYPNITVIGDMSNTLELDITITHEVGHNWFYGILGSNERDLPFMDEGINSFYEMMYTREKYPRKNLAEFIGRDSSFRYFGVNKIPAWKNKELLYYLSLRSHTEQKLDLSSDDYTSFNYGSVIYSKTPIVFDLLMEDMGEAAFEQGMHSYFDNYKFKHPTPQDLFAELQKFTKMDLAVFQKQFISSTDLVDYKIKRVKKNKDGSYNIKVKNKTGTVTPFNIAALTKGQTAAIERFEGFKKTKALTFPPTTADHFKLDANDRLPDVNRKNNISRTSGIFKRSKKLSFNLVTGFEDPNRTQVNFLPLIGGNYYNGFMAGLALHNYGIYKKKTEYMLAPMYGFDSKTVTGFAELDRNFFPNRVFRQITVGLKAKSFAYDLYFDQSKKLHYLNYYKAEPFVQFEIKKKVATSPIQQLLTLSSSQLFTDSVDYRSGIERKKKNVHSMVNQVNYDLNSKRTIDPFSLNMNLQFTGDMAKISSTIYYRITTGKKTSIDVRLFGGAFLAGSRPARSYYAFRGSGYNGYHDYAFENNFIARNVYTGPGFSQFAEKDGNLKIWTPLAQTGEWMAGINLKSPRLFTLPVRIFADAITCDGRSLLKDKVLWDAGVNISVWRNVIEVYIPLVYNDEIKKILELNGIRFFDRIRFTFNIHKLAPRTLIQNNLFN